MSWKDRLQPASFRGIPFKVDGDDLGAGRRTVIHEYPGRDKPSAEDMGRETREYSISAYVIGPDFMETRDQLIGAIETAGPGELVSPWYGTMQVVVQGKQRISHRKEDGGMCVIAFTFTEAGEDDWPTTTPLGSSQLTASSASLLDKAQEYFAREFGLAGLPEWMSLSTIDRASALLGEVAGYIETANNTMSKAMRLMQGDLSVLLPPPSTAWVFARQLENVLDVANTFGSNATSMNSSSGSVAVSSSDATAGSSIAGPALALSTATAAASTAATARPTGGWNTDNTDRQLADTLSNEVAALVRVNLIVTSADAIAILPDPAPPSQITSHQALGVDTTPARSGAANGGAGLPDSGPSPAITTHPAVSVATPITPAAEVVTFEALERAKDDLVAAIDRESERTADDGVYQALRDLRREVIATIKRRQQGSMPLKIRTPTEITPALVLAALWYDDARRADEIVAHNSIVHPGFVPPDPLRTLSL